MDLEPCIQGADCSASMPDSSAVMQQKSDLLMPSLLTHYLLLQLLQDVRRFKAAVLKEEGSLDMVVLATRLAAVGYRVSIRTAVGGGAGQDCFHNLHYTFLLVTGEACYESTEYIVDPCFG